MLSKLKHVMLAGFVASVLVFLPIASVSAANLGDTTACDGANLAGASVNCSDGKLSDDGFGGIVKTIINILSIVVGAVSVIMIIIGGFRYVISGGDSNGVSGAKNTIIYAIVGLVIVLFAQVIVRFVMKNTQTGPCKVPGKTNLSITDAKCK